MDNVKRITYNTVNRSKLNPDTFPTITIREEISMKSPNKKRFTSMIFATIILTLIVSVFFSWSALSVNANNNLNASNMNGKNVLVTNRLIQGFNNAQLEPEPRQLAPGQAAYKEEYYVEQLDGSFALMKTVNKTGNIDEVVAFTGEGDPNWDAIVVLFPDGNMGFLPMYGHQDTVDGRLVTADGNLVLKMYFERNTFHYTFKNHASVEIQNVAVKFGATLTAPEAPVRDGCRFEGWVIEDPGTVSGGACSTVGAPVGSVGAAVNREIGVGEQAQRYVPVYSVGEPNPPVEPVNPVDPVDPVNPVNPGEVFELVLTAKARSSVSGSQNKGRSCQDDGYPKGYVWNGVACVVQGSYKVPNTGVK